MRRKNVICEPDVGSKSNRTHVCMCVRSSTTLIHAWRTHPYQPHAIKMTKYDTSLNFFYCLHFSTLHYECDGCFSMRVTRETAGRPYPRSKHNVFPRQGKPGNKEHHLLLAGAESLRCSDQVGVGVLMHASVSRHVTMSRGALIRRRAVSIDVYTWQASTKCVCVCVCV